MEGRPPRAPRRSLSPSTTRQQVCRPGGCLDDYDCMSYRQPLSGKCQGSVRLQSCSTRKNTPREPILTILALALFGHSLVRTAMATCFCNTVRRATATYSTRVLIYIYGVKRPAWPGATNALRITLRATRQGPPLFQIFSKVHTVPPRAFSHVLRSDLYFRIRSI